jgi:hypothetical protein
VCGGPVIRTEERTPRPLAMSEPLQKRSRQAYSSGHVVPILTRMRGCRVNVEREVQLQATLDTVRAAVNSGSAQPERFQNASICWGRAISYMAKYALSLQRLPLRNSAA